MNPYVQQDQLPTLRPSVFCFLDALGYSQFSGMADGQELTERLRGYHAALTRGAEILKAPDRQKWIAPMRGAHDAAVKAFTDNIVIGIPVHFDDGENEVGEAFRRIGNYQLEMVNSGYFIRGAISFGDIYIDDLAVFGVPLIEAHDGERDVANNPRIVLTESAKELTKQHLAYYGNGPHAPQNSDLKSDADGVWFLDYLESVMLAPDEGAFGDAEIAKHRDAVGAKLQLYAASSQHILTKYQWVARYHNWFCRKYDAYFRSEHMIAGIEPAEGITSIIQELPACGHARSTSGTARQTD